MNQQQLGDENFNVTLFEEQPVRRAWHDGRWFYSVIDVCAVLVQNDNPRRYWSDLKRKLKAQGFTEVYEKIVQLTMPAPDGKQRETDCVNMEAMLRIIQSIPSPKAEPFKRWLAHIGAELIDDRTEDQKRIDYREREKTIHKHLHGEIHHRGIKRPGEHAEFDDRGHRVFYDGESVRDTEERRGIPPGEGHSWESSEEMVDNLFRATQTQAYIKRLDIQGKEPLNQAHETISKQVRDAIIGMGNTPPEQLPKAAKSIEQAAKDEERRRTKGMDLFPEISEGNA